MTIRHRSFALVIIAVIAAALLSQAVDPALAAKTPWSAHKEAQPHDLPGEPALPIPGAPRAEPISFNGFNSVQVNVSFTGANIPGDAANEPSIAVDPTDPNHMAIGWRQFDTVSSSFRQAGYAFTEDGGRTWIFPARIEAGVFRSDPVLSYDSSGRFYYSSLRVIGNDFDVDIWPSNNRGLTWGPPVPAFGGDKQWITVDRTGGIGDGNLYQAWSIAAACCGNNIFTRSTDGVASFETPVTIPNTPVWGTMDVAPDGTLYIPGTDFGNLSLIYVSKSTNAQNPAVTPTFTQTQTTLGGSLNFSTGPNPGGLLGQIDLAVNPTNGDVYLLCSVDPPGNDPMDVKFSRSTDGGDTWSAPVRVNDDAQGPNAWQWFGTMSVAPNGRIDVIWNDSRNTQVATWSELYYASSTDGGVTWTANEPMSPGWDSTVGWPQQNKIGDYYDMVSDDVGASLAWAATFNGEQDVYYLRIGDYDCNVNGVPDTQDILDGTSGDTNMNGIPDECEGIVTAVSSPESPAVASRLSQNVPNPFNPTTTIEYEAAARSHVLLRVFDPRGTLVRTLVDEKTEGGGASVTWDGTDDRGQRVASGPYFYRLEVNGTQETRKMLLLK